MTQVLLLVFVLDVPALGVGNDAENSGIQLARRIDVTLGRKTLDVVLNFFVSWEFVFCIVELTGETWELVQLPRRLLS